MTPALFRQHHNQPWPLLLFVCLAGVVRHGVGRHAAVDNPYDRVVIVLLYHKPPTKHR